MTSTGSVLLIVLLAAVLIVLGVGIVSMLRGGEFNRRYGNKLMQLRVLLQGLALLVLALLFLFSGRS